MVAAVVEVVMVVVVVVVGLFKCLIKMQSRPIDVTAFIYRMLRFQTQLQMYWFGIVPCCVWACICDMDVAGFYPTGAVAAAAAAAQADLLWLAIIS